MQYGFEDLSIGLTAEYRKTMTETDVVLFAGLSGDNNPMHIDEEFARETRFGSRIIHGMLTASLLSTVIGTRMPGPGVIYMAQNLRFLKPVKIGDTVTATATVSELIPEKQRARLLTTCTVRGETVIDGDALVWVPLRRN
ncbi:MaoC family dehydratase [Jeongeupia sp. USM3]|uniref:MaoC family dehydratase n=1 Tax=Jeongeupia sp. USM3 TaxID=1906741 RepID=UPI00089DF763|nr:MaoC family dehydratase [Jeongeupia sp. USM3]AOX99770.1 (R)-hydratase [Jeongeupia sp. USM3]